MHKGFTLIELLMVVVIVGVLVAVALPQYKRTVERGRAMEGLANARAAADYTSAYYLVHEALPDTFITRDLVQQKFFNAPYLEPIPGEDTRMSVVVKRKTGDGWDYKFVATFEGPEVLSIKCVNVYTDEDVCMQLGFDPTKNLLKEN